MAPDWLCTNLNLLQTLFGLERFLFPSLVWHVCCCFLWFKSEFTDERSECLKSGLADRHLSFHICARMTPVFQCRRLLDSVSVRHSWTQRLTMCILSKRAARLRHIFWFGWKKNIWQNHISKLLTTNTVNVYMLWCVKCAHTVVAV